MSLNRTIPSSGHLIVSAFRNAGGFDGEILSEEALEIRRDAMRWIEDTDKLLPQLRAAEIPVALSWYDLVYRVAYSKAPEDEKIYSPMYKAFRSMLHGEEADEVAFVRWIKKEIRRKKNNIDLHLLGWYSSVIEKWLKELNPYREEKRFTAADIRKVNILLSENLEPWHADEESYKRKLVEKILPIVNDFSKQASSLLSHLSSPGTLHHELYPLTSSNKQKVCRYNVEAITFSSESIEAIGEFVFLALRYNREIDAVEISAQTKEILARHPDLEPIEREAYLLDLLTYNL